MGETVTRKDTKKEKALADLINSGDSQAAVAKRHGVSPATLGRWAKDTKITVKGLGVIVNEAAEVQAQIMSQRRRIGEKLMRAIEGVLDAEIAMAEVLQDKDFITSKPAEAGELLQILHARTDRYTSDGRTASAIEPSV
jgi:transposase-like protein